MGAHAARIEHASDSAVWHALAVEPSRFRKRLLLVRIREQAILFASIAERRCPVNQVLLALVPERRCRAFANRLTLPSRDRNQSPKIAAKEAFPLSGSRGEDNPV